MDEWRERLAGIDDDYLVGISNKGIVKRAYKDMEEGRGKETAAEIGALDNEVTVKLGAETVTVRFPLGESSCTCPSRSICRHVVQAILVLRENCLKEGTDREGQGTDASPAEAEGTESAEGMAEGWNGRDSNSIPGSGQKDNAKEGAGDNTKEDAKDNTKKEIKDSTKDGIKDSINETAKVSTKYGAATQDSPVWKEINAYPFEKLKKALGSRSFQSLANQAASGIRPQIQTSSVVTVRLPEQGMTVKLLSPLEYSTCTCHKKELCRHKAAAILWCRMEAGKLGLETLQGEAADMPAYDLEEVRDVAGQMEAFLEELMGTGLSRVSHEIPDHLERLAIISHNAKLSRFEGYFRALSDSYGRYFARKAAFRTEDLLEQLTRLYRRAQLLRQAEGLDAVGELAGEFRADYLPVGDLDLIGIAMEHFQSQTGYEGESVYFLEENTGKWYTYTNARPVFYDDSKRKGYAGKNQARQATSPWGLNIPFENLLKVRIHLTGAKCDGRNRLSSSQETKGEVTGETGLCISDIKKWYYRDFGMLFREQIGKQQREWLAEQGEPEGRGAELVFVQPDTCGKAEFSETQQLLTLPLYDAAGRELLVEVAYSKQESGTIRYLERISEKKLFCFLGKVYLRDGRLRMYPVDLLDPEKIDEIDEADAKDRAGAQGSGLQESHGTDLKAEGRQAGGELAASGEPAAAEGPGEPAAAERSGEPAAAERSGKPAAAERSGEPTAAERSGEPATTESSGESGQPAATEGPEYKEGEESALSADHKPKYLVMEEMADEILSPMADLCQSGFSTVHDSTLKDLRAAASLAAQYGMEYLSGLLAALEEELTANRHRMKQENGILAAIYTDINEYLYILKQKNEYDRGGSYYA